MSIKTKETQDKVEFINGSKWLQERVRIDIVDNGEIVSSKYERNTFEIQEIKKLPKRLQPYAEGVWTEKLIKEHNSKKEETKPEAKTKSKKK